MSDEVSDFLRSVEQLKDRRDEEDEARSRELEEKILQEKRERQARRAGKSLPIHSDCCRRDGVVISIWTRDNAIVITGVLRISWGYHEHH